MGKKKQQKLYRLNNKKQNVAKQEMNDILKQLSQIKHSKQKSPTDDLRPLDMGLFKKKIKKEQKEEKYLKKHQNAQKQEQSQQNEIQAPKVNIFSVDTYESGMKTILHNKPVEQMYDESRLLNQTLRLMDGDVNLQKFGDKPLKIIEQQEKVQLSDDEDQPNSIKNITHKDLAIPSGNYKFQRTKQIEEFREKLPIYMKEQEIIETINNHLVTLICGQTGSGKSTQIGQFLIQKNYHEFGKIAITQPRRLATISLAVRVAEETGSKIGKVVGYQVRHDRKDSTETLIKYLTDGILLNEMSSDYLLNKYSVIVIDEAHERKVNTDILIGLLSKLVIVRYQLSLQNKAKPLRLVIMSATMRVQDFQNIKLFGYAVPIINVESRMFPVTIYFEKNTPEDYKEAAVKKCLKIHKKLPSGDVLIFLTGKEQIHEVSIMLQNALSGQQLKNSDDEQQMDEEMNQGERPSSYIIYCLYSSLPMSEQQKIFNTPPNNCRKFVISTNIAETSITIPNIRYVIDSGQEKHRYHEGVWKWRKGWGSRAMAEQRSGRAGRTTHGYCYRLYSSALYANIMDEYPLPEISKLPLEGVILQLKSIGIENVYDFPFPTSPDISKLKPTLESLLQIKAISGSVNELVESTKITQLGQILSFLPLDPKLGKILLMGRKLKVQKYALLLVILLTVETIFNQNNYKINFKAQADEQNIKGKFFQEMRTKIGAFRTKYKSFIMEGHFGDIFTCINIIGQFFTSLYKDSGSIHSKIKKESAKLQLNENIMREIYYNTDQLAQIYETLCGQKFNLTEYKQPNNQEITSILDILLQIFIKNLCRIEDKHKYKDSKDHLVLIHHLSDTYLKNNMFLGCIQFYGSQNGKNYMRYPFPIKNYELLASFGHINPPNQFLWRDNKIVGLSTGTIFGWEIPNLFIQTVDNDVKYVYIAKYLLEGKILQELKVLQKYLKSPTSIIKPGSINYQVLKLIETIKIHKIDSLEKMLDGFKKDRKFLKEQLRGWVSMNNFDQTYEKIRKSIVMK